MYKLFKGWLNGWVYNYKTQAHIGNTWVLSHYIHTGLLGTASVGFYVVINDWSLIEDIELRASLLFNQTSCKLHQFINSGLFFPFFQLSFIFCELNGLIEATFWFCVTDIFYWSCKHVFQQQLIIIVFLLCSVLLFVASISEADFNVT
jgi:hypothetical protein